MDGLLLITHLIAASSSWLYLSDWPFNCRWWPDVRLDVAPKAWQKKSKKNLQTWEISWGFQSDIISQGIPFNQNTCWVKSWVVSNAEESLGRIIKWAALENLTIIFRITELPSENGNLMTKSKAMCDQGCPGVGSGYSKPDRGWRLFLFWEQVEHATTNSFMSGVMVDHQKCLSIC